MDRYLTIIAFALANAVLFFPIGSAAARLLQVALVVLLGVLLLLKILQLRRAEEAAPVKDIPVPQQAGPAPLEAAPPPPELGVESGVLQFLARLQEKGRLVDFLMDDITPYSNEQIGVVARVVHQGGREVIKAAFDIKPVHGGDERETITLAGDFDACAYRLVGKVPPQPPYRGTVLHRGWQTTRVSLPRASEAGAAAARKIIAPAEVEIG